MKKIIIIDRCTDCKHWELPCFVYECHHPDLIKPKGVGSGDSIPEWCPLENTIKE